MFSNLTGLRPVSAHPTALERDRSLEILGNVCIYDMKKAR
jgi:hypothetical protein